MNCNLKMELTTELLILQGALERLDSFLRDWHTNSAEIQCEAFMSAWNKVKTAKQTILSINLEDRAE